MPNKKAAAKDPKVIKEELKEKGEKKELYQIDSLTNQRLENIIASKKRKYFIPGLFLFVLILIVLGYLFRSKFIAATIDGKPIFQCVLNKRLISAYGKETLENLIVEGLIQKEAKSKGVTVSDKDVDDEITKLEKNLGSGMKIEDALKMQGITLAEFKDQLELRLQVNKILEKEIALSSDEIDKYLKDNAKTIVATGESERKEEAKQILMEQKISNRVQTWVSELLAKAKITRFLK